VFDRGFVFYWLKTDAFQHAVLGVSRSAQNGFNKSDLETLRVPVPSMAEQERVVRTIETAYTWIERLVAEAAKARKLTTVLEQAILNKAFRGQLVSQDARDEPSSVLLRRIQEGRRGVSPAGSQRRARKSRGAK
jgi:type I restriction enzyme S subunit